MILINNTTARIIRFTCSVLLLGVVTSIQSSYTGGRAHNVAVLSALVLRNENSVGCQRPEMTLSWCCATTTLGRGIVRSPEEVESVQSTVWDIRHSQRWLTTLREHNELEHPNIITSANHDTMHASTMTVFCIFIDKGQFALLWSFFDERLHCFYTTENVQTRKKQQGLADI